MSIVPRDDGNATFPYIWQPSSEWDGVDGKWSSFTINVGDDGTGGNGQDFRVLISTSGSSTYVPGASNLCNDATDRDACYNSRGIEIYAGEQSGGFAQSESSAWKLDGTYDIGLDTGVDYHDVGVIHGTDNIGIGAASGTSKILRTRPLAILANDPVWFMGMFGLSNLPITPQSNVPTDTFLTEFDTSDQIPSRSYGYTAGSFNANGGKGVTGSLTLGGYDSARVTANNQVTVSMPGGSPGQNTSLVVGVQQIRIDSDDGNQQTELDNGEFLATIDSTLPYFWFPSPIVDQLEEEFGLIWDEDAGPDGLYTLNSTQRADNEGKRMTIRIGNNVGDPNFANIDLSFPALTLGATSPFVENDTSHFPLKRSPTGQFVLGRTFLQHAYIAVDYERRNFTVSRAVISDPMPSEQIITIWSPGTEPQVTPTDNGSNGGSKLGGGAIAGIVIGALAAVALVAAAIFFFIRRRKNQKQKEIDEKGYYPPEHPASPPPQYRNDKPANIRRTSELDDSSRSTSAQGYYYGHRRSESGSNITELVGSPPMNSDEKAYLKQVALETDPAPLAELPGDHGLSELPQARRPKPKRHRSSGSGGSNGRVQSPESERIDPILEAEEHSPIERRVTTPEVTVTDTDQIIPTSRIESPDPEELTRGTTNTAGFSETSLEAQTQRTETTNATSITRESSQSETTQTKSGQGLLS